MAAWVAEDLENLLHQINEVPFTDSREKQQLTILMNGFAQMNNRVMDRAAEKTRKEFRGWNLDAKTGTVGKADADNSTEDELTRLRPIK